MQAHQVRALALAAVIPGRAGFYHDTLRNVIVALTGGGEPLASTRLLPLRFAPELLRGRAKHSRADIVVRGAKYTYARKWRRRL